MSKGACLCGSVTWAFNGEPVRAYHCHCGMCRKAHGAAFGTYYYVAKADFCWTSDQDTVVGYASSPQLTRPFCGTCGSVVPGADSTGEYIFVPVGCHDEGPAPEAHICVAFKAPWYDITDGLTQHEIYPPGDNDAVYDDKVLPDAPEGVIRGSCLCGAIEFQVTEPFRAIHNCFCSRCRRARAAAHTTNGFTSLNGVRFTNGEHLLTRYKVPEARYFTHVFCSICGSGMPRLDEDRKIAVVPLGALDDDPGSKPQDNIDAASKARWYDITDDLPTYDERPPG